MIKLQIIGRLGRDAEVNNVNGKSVINFSVAHSEKFKNNGEQVEKTVWVSCGYWTDKTAIVPYLKKGVLVFVEGSTESKTYQKEGETKAMLTMRVSAIQLLSKAEDNQTTQDTQSNYGKTSVPADASFVIEQSDDLPF